MMTVGGSVAVLAGAPCKGWMGRPARSGKVAPIAQAKATALVSAPTNGWPVARVAAAPMMPQTAKNSTITGTMMIKKNNRWQSSDTAMASETRNATLDATCPPRPAPNPRVAQSSARK